MRYSVILEGRARTPSRLKIPGDSSVDASIDVSGSSGQYHSVKRTRNLVDLLRDRVVVIIEARDLEVLVVIAGVQDIRRVCRRAVRMRAYPIRRRL